MTTSPRKKKPTVHNPTNFEPSDYTVLGYIDNQPPYVSPFIDWSDPAQVEFANRARQVWQDEMTELFPKRNTYKCEHCGQGNVRYVVSALHEPTGEHTCFGDICCNRLGLKNHQEFRAKMIRSAAATAAKAAALDAAKVKFLEENQSFAEVVKSLRESKEIHARNSFAFDVWHKFEKYGELSERQVASFISSIARDKKWAADKAAEKAKMVDIQPLDTGKLILSGEIKSLKSVVHEIYGASMKMLVLLDDGNKVYGTRPAKISDAEVGDKITFVANVDVSQDDSHFGFFSRPSKAIITSCAKA